ncbi:protein rep [Bifidobacterium boum]|uniref:protein rep n=1 Tax=Bifidobacterium boum TaxID=78343 RepID=UPI003F92346D
MTVSSLAHQPKTAQSIKDFGVSMSMAAMCIRPYVEAYRKGGAAALDSIASNVAANTADDQPVPSVSSRLTADRWMQRRAMRRIFRGTRVASCGRIARKDTGHIRVWFDKEHGGRFSGLQTCGSVWVCPVCNHKIQAVRCDEVKTMLEHCKTHGWDVVFATLTVRHDLSQSLQEVEAMASTVWRAVNQHRKVRAMKERVNCIGYVRASESTWSANAGWHWHYHVYFIFLNPLKGRTVQIPVYKRAKDHTMYIDHFDERDAFEDFRDTLTSDWVDTAVKKGYAAPRFANQVFETIDFTKESTLEAASRYCTSFKTATTPMTSKLGHELTDTQSKVGKVKRHANGRDVRHFTYWDFVRILSMPSDLAERTLSDFIASTSRGSLTVPRRCFEVAIHTRCPHVPGWPVHLPRQRKRTDIEVHNSS